MTPKTLTLLVGTMNTPTLFLFLMTIETQLLCWFYQPAGIITGMCRMAGKTVSISDRRMLLHIIGIGTGRIVTRQT
jgi:hypothetical protein